MKKGKHLDLGEFAQGTAGYTGYHRDVEPVTKVEGIYGISLGNRSTKPCYGVSEVEERACDPNIRRI